MKKLGFTLAEVLIALTIIGVVAAMTIPSLVTEHKKDVFAKSLSAAVSDLETAFTTYIMTDPNVAYTLFDTEMYKNNTFNDLDEALKGRIKLKKVADDMKEYYPDINGVKIKALNPKLKTDALTENYNNGPVYETKKGFAFIINIMDKNHTDTKPIPEKTKDEILKEGGSLYLRAANILIDVNGKNKPNTVGRDIFAFLLGSDGYLYPYGGKDANIFDENILLFTETNCPSNIKQAPENTFTCTERLIRNNYKMDY